MTVCVTRVQDSVFGLESSEPIGHGSCSHVRIMAQRLQEIVAWQLADELRKQLVAVTETGPFAREYKLRAQIRDAANSASANIAEGFKRFNPREFAQFMKYSRGSLAEISVHLSDARDRRLITADQFAALSHLAARTAIAGASEPFRTLQNPSEPISS